VFTPPESCEGILVGSTLAYSGQTVYDVYSNRPPEEWDALAAMLR
jgi:hypothetical protein